MYYAVMIIVALLIVLWVIIHKYNLMKAYYQYMKKEAERLERNHEKESEEKKKKIDELQNIAYLNATTNIWNIDYFLEKGKKELENPENKSNTFTLVAFNIINIGKINQLFGPTEGDRVVYFTAQTLKKETIHQVYAQIYSNLFCILFNGKDDEYVIRTINRIHTKLITHDENIQIQTAFGIYKVEDKSMKIMDMINYAQLALKFVKADDDFCYKYFSKELDDQFNKNKAMSIEMEAALDAHKFMVYLQPMYDLHSNKIVSAEALVRWDYPGKGVLSPYAFLPLFESTSLIQKLDYYMWEECMKTIRRWIDNKIEPTPVTMNISPSHLNNFKFVNYLVELRDRYLIQNDLLILEIPERGLANMNDLMKEVICKLHDEGFILCIDNFGSLNSPLNLLKDLPIDRIKLDRSFLVRNSDSDEGLTILKYLIAMAKELDFTVITEGIETEEQVRTLIEIGCDIGQGYHFSKPVDLRTFDGMNKSVISELYRPDEYYPTFEDYEKDLDLMAQFLRSREMSANG